METMLARRETLREQLASGRVPEPCEGCAMARYAVLGPMSLLRLGARALLQRIRRRDPAAG